MDDQQITDAEARVAELAAIIAAAETAGAERAELVRALREHDPRHYTQARLAVLAGMTQQAVAKILDPERTQWELRTPDGQPFKLTGPTLKEAILANRARLASAFYGSLLAYNQGECIADVHARENPHIVSRYNFEVEVEVARPGREREVDVLMACRLPRSVR